MSITMLADMTWEEVDALDRSRTIAILPVGAIEAHGPHLPLGTDGIIADAMATAGAERLAARGWHVVVMPRLDYTPAEFARDFAGTVSASTDAYGGIIVDVVSALTRHGFETVVIANAHLDPDNLGSIRRAVEVVRREGLARLVFPDVTQKPWALRLTDEFKSGACHAGRYEGSIVMAARPGAVRAEIQASLPDNPASLSQAIRHGRATFAEAGGSRAYFGYPAQASVEEGRATIDTLGAILEEATLAAIGPAADPPGTSEEAAP